VFGQKFTEPRGVACDQRRRAALRKPRREQLLVGVTQAARFVDHQHAGLFGALEQVGRVNELHIEGWVLAHQNYVEFGQIRDPLGPETVPVPWIIDHFEAAHPGVTAPVAQKQIAHLHIVQGPAACPGREQHREAAVLFHMDGSNRIHDDSQIDWHTHPVRPRRSHPQLPRVIADAAKKQYRTKGDDSGGHYPVNTARTQCDRRTIRNPFHNRLVDPRSRPKARSPRVPRSARGARPRANV